MWKDEMESEMQDGCHLSVTDSLKCLRACRDPGFSFDQNIGQVVNHGNENLMILINKQCMQCNVCGL